MKKMNHMNHLVLDVSSANVDLANSDALKGTKEVDPHGVSKVSTGRQREGVF